MQGIRRTVMSHKIYESVPVKLQLTEEEMARSRCIGTSSPAWTSAPA
ncbi:MAG: hypothetical protein U1F35_15820 [Steroidobacteraceae bacterium]